MRKQTVNVLEMLPRNSFGCASMCQRLKIQAFVGITMFISVGFLFHLLPRTLSHHDPGNRLQEKSASIKNENEKVLTYGMPTGYSLAMQENCVLGKHPIAHPGPRQDEKHAIVSTPYTGCQRRLPNSLLAGFHKCGTNTLMHFLKFHPSISAVLKPTEVHFFSEYFHLGLQWYRNQMTCSLPEQITMECSPDYAYTPKVPERVYKTNKDMKIVFAVRNPVDAIISHYTMKASNNKTLYPSINTKPLRHFLLDANGNISARSFWIHEYSYYTHLQNWLNYFSTEQIHVVDGDHFARCPFNEIQKLERFLDVRPHFKENDFVFNVSKGFYCLHLQTYNETWCNGPNKGRRHLPVENALQDKLYVYFEKENEKLFQLLGRRFNWTRHQDVLKRCA